MKRILAFIVIFLIVLLMLGYDNNGERNVSSNQQSIANKIIRFHVLANSDSNDDQALKLKVRDKVLAFISPKMSKSTSVNESKQLLLKYNNDINSIAQKVVRQNGYNYGVTTELSKDYFPIKTYGAITLPEGKYDAYRILIGSAKGHNWWCVMFPPLCFTDITKGNVEVEKTQNEMKKVLTKEEYDMVDNSKGTGNKIVVRFKIVDLIEGLAKKLRVKI
ncbi:stage II sporulation protein R [Clostridium akagii]|uniref:stage II sporulation protein R n=1 Tax=Clostridium akagii TaxID=91623 RepID=UPI00047937DE|nr:stage II sporulation protein R [Clostridium akagii]